MGRSDGKPFSSLGPATFKHGASGAGAHAFAKAVFVFPFAITRLICSFHFLFFSLDVKMKLRYRKRAFYLSSGFFIWTFHIGFYEDTLT